MSSFGWLLVWLRVKSAFVFFAKRSPSQSKSIPIGLDVDGITFAISPPPGKVPIADSKQHPGEYNIRPASDYIWTAPWPQFWPEKFWHQINLTPIFHIFLKVYCKLLSSFIIILNFFSYPHKYIENSSYVFQYKILNFTLISKNNLNCHNFAPDLNTIGLLPHRN